MKRFYEFGPFRIDAEKRVLLRDAVPVSLAPKALDMLLVLVQHRGQAMEKDRLMELLWPESDVEEANLPQNVSALRKALGETRNDRRYIITIPGRGYRFAAEVNEWDDNGMVVLEKQSLSTVVMEERQEGPRTGVRMWLQKFRRPPSLKAADAVNLARVPRIAIRNLAVLAGLVVTASTAWFYINRSPVLTSKDTILLADFENTTGDEVFDDMLKQGLAIQLQQSPFLNLFPQEQVQQTLSLMGRPQDERVTAELARAICERENVEALIRGSIAPLGSHYVITLEAINGQSGESLARQLAEAGSKEQVLRALAQAATGLREKLGESLSSIRQRDRMAEDATTPSLEAFKFFARGAEMAISGRGIEAIPFLIRAVAIDPNFAYAWSLLSLTHGFSGRPDLAAEYAQKAYALKEGVGEYEKLRITYWYHAWFTGDFERRTEALMLQEQMYPRKWLGRPADFAVTYALIGQYDQAIAPAREAISRLPNFAAAHRVLAHALLRLNRFTESKNVLAQAFRENVDNPDSHSYLYEMAFIHGDTAAMRQQLDWASGKPYEYIVFDWQAGTAAFAGQWRRAQELSRRAIDLAAHGDTKEVAARYAAEQALRLAVLSSNFSLPSPENRKLKPEIQTLAQTALNFARGRASLPRAALALALCGQTGQAKPLVDELTKRYPQDTLINAIWLPVIRAAIELQRGNATGAIEQLQTTVRYEAAAEFWPQYLRGQAYLKLKQATEAATEFQKILDHRGQAPLSVLYPLAQLGSARAAVLAGDMAKSRAAFEDFFKMWKSADADLPILIDAKREYGKK